MGTAHIFRQPFLQDIHTVVHIKNDRNSGVANKRRAWPINECQIVSFRKLQKLLTTGSPISECWKGMKSFQSYSAFQNALLKKHAVSLTFTLMLPLNKCLVSAMSVSWLLEEWIMCIYGYACAFSINHCCFSRLKTFASSDCFIQRQDSVSSPCVHQPAGTMEDKQACQRRPKAAGWTSGHKNHKNPDSGMAEQQLRPLWGWFRWRKGRAASQISMDFYSSIFFWSCVGNLTPPPPFSLYHFVVFLPSEGSICCHSFLSTMKNNFSGPGNRLW